MANSQQILEIKLDARNRLLKSERRGVTIQIRKDGFTLRAYLPSKTNPESNQTIQQRVPINLKADIKNLDEAHRLAKKLSDEKIGGSFKWENWQKKEEEEETDGENIWCRRLPSTRFSRKEDAGFTSDDCIDCRREVHQSIRCSRSVTYPIQ